MKFATDSGFPNLTFFIDDGVSGVTFDRAGWNEMIRLAARMGASLPGRILRAPGFLFQLLTTREPDREQLEVAVVALREALGDSAPEHMHTVSYTVLE